MSHLVCHVSHVNEDEDNNDNVNNDRSTTKTKMWRDGSFQLFKPRRLVTATTFTAFTIIVIFRGTQFKGPGMECGMSNGSPIDIVTTDVKLVIFIWGNITGTKTLSEKNWRRNIEHRRNVSNDKLREHTWTKHRRNGMKNYRNIQRRNTDGTNWMNKLAKLGDAIAISKSETINDPLTDRGNC